MPDARTPATYPPPPPGRLQRLGATLVALGAVLGGKALMAAGLRRPPEGWRRTVGVLLRSESTRFALSAFGLAVPAPHTRPSRGSLEAQTANRLREFLAGEPDAYFRLEWSSPITTREAIPVIDLVVLGFAADGALVSISPVLDEGGPPLPPADVRHRVHRLLVRTYNATARWPEALRVPRLISEIRHGLGGSSAERRYADRLFSSCSLSFESVDLSDPAHRFSPPAFAERRSFGGGYLSWIARLDDRRGTVDLWVSAHHVGLDGVPLQDLLNRLERAWGVPEPPRFPEPTGARTFAGPVQCHAPGERAVEQLLTFADLTPVLALRRVLNTRYGSAIAGDVTLGALLAWLVSEDAAFRGVRIASTVDVSASAGYQRDVDVVSLRAEDFRRGPDEWDGFVEYAREFNRMIAAARARTSPVRIGMQTAGLIPPWAHAAAVRGNPAALDEMFGTLCITIIRDARVFIAPMTDHGLGHGFFAVGNVSLPTASGTPVASVSIKGDAGRVAEYPRILQRIIDRAGELCRQVRGSP